jgi:hypothetical protein
VLSLLLPHKIVYQLVSITEKFTARNLVMAKTDKLIQKILRGHPDASIGFEELRSLLKSLGFDERVRGSHHIFRRADVEERLNLQREDSNLPFAHFFNPLGFFMPPH